MKETNLHHLYTKRGENGEFSAWETVHPRPQLLRESYMSLCGEWDFSAQGIEPCKIRVPFPPESLLSGVHRSMGKTPRLRYSRSFRLPEGFVRGRVLLHFGAVDQIAVVTLNGVRLGRHEGGYGAFSFDVTKHLKEENLLVVDVLDELANGILPYGKQREKRGGMWYTPTSGIWQSVWLESVPETYVKSLRITPNERGATVEAEGVDCGEITVSTPDGEERFALENGKCEIMPKTVRAWSPEDPYRYCFVLSSGEDEVYSYFAIRTLDIREVDGISRLCLNGKPYFFHALLDQGYYSDGIYTPASPHSYEDDILAMKALGFNTLRKHIKVEPELFYYYCDKHGMVVFQDMVNNGDYSFFRDTALPTVGLKSFPDRLLHTNKHARKAFLKGMHETVKQLYNHPSICYWTIFNEGWGQFSGSEAYRLLKEEDDTRFIDTTSGWFHGAETDVTSLHVYFKPVRLKPSAKPIVLSEFGGYSYKPEGHVFNEGNTYGYRFFKERDAFEEALVKLYTEEIIPLVARGLCASVYTQVSDVEDETNGLLSYDRQVLKVTPETMLALAEQLKLD